MRELVEAIRRIAKLSQSEEDLKLAIEPLIRQHLQVVSDVMVQPSYEVRTGLVGRRDAVYGHFTIEYKRPGYLASEGHLRRAAQKLAEYLETAGGGTQVNEALKRVAGACTDGQHIFFLRFWPRELIHGRQMYPRPQLSLFGSKAAPGGYQLLGPYPVNEASLDQLFRYLRALGRQPLIAEELAKVFGPGTEVAQNAVGTLYRALAATRSERVRAFYRQWERTFGIVYGEEMTDVEKDVGELARGYGLPEKASLKPALFAVHTYFALIMKLLAAEILALQEGALAPSLLSELPGLEGTALRERLVRLEIKNDYLAYGIRNFLEGDFFRWYLDAWDEPMSATVGTLARELASFEPTTPTLRPSEARDLLKKLYQYLVPKKLRHDLGEYYTPDWLAERLLNQLGYDGDPNVRLLDPACGSGTFLTLALARVREKMEFELWDRDPRRRRECAEKALRNIVGFDLNPLAVIAARTNYLLAFGDLLRDVRPVEIPVYNCDAILTPILQKRAQKGQTKLFDPDQDYFYLPTAVGEFRMPKAVLDHQALGPVTAILEQCVEGRYTTEELLARVTREVSLDDGACQLLEELYGKLSELERQGKNGVWVKLLKNGFAPVLQEPFDLVVGNPPWVNWEHLPESWREVSKELWMRYGLFSLKGHAARLGGGKKDLAMLFTYACADHYLKSKGQLGFVITQTVFKTKGAGDGFRRFQLGEKGTPLRVKTVDDLSDLQPFEGATNRTAILTLVKGEPTRYPVSYTVWRRKRGQRIALESSLKEAGEQCQRRHCLAEPVDPKNPTSPWITANRYVLSALRKVVGESPYRAYAGACTWLNGVYWVRILERRPDGLVVIENLGDVGKNQVPTVRAAIEPDLLYPLLRGRDIQPWRAVPEAWILLTQDPERRTGWPEARMKTERPHTYQYLKQFERELRQRSGFRQYFNPDKDPFWSMYNVGTYTMAPYKVVWREQAQVLTCALASSAHLPHGHSKLAIPDHKVLFVPTEQEEEACFIAALLGSQIARLVVKSYALETSISTHLMDFVRLPKFCRAEQLHRDLAAIAARLRDNPAAIDELQEEVDRLAAELWGLSNKELRAVQRELEQEAAQP